MRSVLFLVVLALSIVVGPAAAAGDDALLSASAFRDMTDSGAAIAFRNAGPGKVALDLLEDPSVNLPVFEVRGKEGQRVDVLFPAPETGWTARAWTGPGTWRSLPASASLDGLVIFLTIRRERELVELLPPGFGQARASYYRFADLTDYINNLPSDPRLDVSVLGNSVQGRPIYRIIFDDPNSAIPTHRKRTVVVIVRQHGDEWSCSFVFEGMLDFLLGLNDLLPDERQPGPEITEQVRWVFYPMVNPDGTELYQRYNAHGVDLNRNWSATGPQSWQEPETFLVQTDLANLPHQDTIRVVGDHHGWGGTLDGGYRYDNGGWPASVTHPVYLESIKDTSRYTQYEPMVKYWYENGGQNGMSRVELHHWKGWVVHTPEYGTDNRDEDPLRIAGGHYMLAMRDTSYALSLSGPVVTIGYPLMILVDEDDENASPTQQDRLRIYLHDWVTKDLERVVLIETGNNTGIFTRPGGFPLESGPASSHDGVLQTAAGSWIVGYYRDADLAIDKCYVLLTVAQ